MNRIRWTACAAALALAGCLSAQDAAEQWANPYCQRLQSCFPEEFPQTYPGGVDECVGQQILGTSVNTNSAGCSASTLNSCVSDVKSLACADVLADQAVPTSCDTCSGSTAK
jgi:hypothetical protein